MVWTTEMRRAWFDAEVFEQVWRDPGAPASYIADRLHGAVTTQSVTASLKRLIVADLVERVEKPRSYPSTGYVVLAYGVHRAVRARMGFTEGD